MGHDRQHASLREVVPVAGRPDRPFSAEPSGTAASTPAQAGISSLAPWASTAGEVIAESSRSDRAARRQAAQLVADHLDAILAAHLARQDDSASTGAVARRLRVDERHVRKLRKGDKPLRFADLLLLQPSLVGELIDWLRVQRRLTASANELLGTVVDGVDAIAVAVSRGAGDEDLDAALGRLQRDVELIRGQIARRVRG